MTIRIEITRSHIATMRDRWNLRIGDIEGSKTLYNLTFDEVLDEIKLEMRSLGSYSSQGAI